MNQNRNGNFGPPRLRIAVHSLIFIAESGKVLPSSAIAKQVNSHATFLRRVMASLNKNGIVKAREGRDGGYYLYRPLEEITLAEIFLAVKNEDCNNLVLETEACKEAGAQIDEKLEGIMQQAESQMVEYLKQYTLADVAPKR